MPSIHSVRHEQVHQTWDNSNPPAIRIASGDTVSFDCHDASNGQFTRTSTAVAVTNLNFSALCPVSGPVFVETAEPGDVLQIDIIDLETADWGWTAVIPGFGLLADEFPEPALKIWEIDKKAGVAYFDKEKRIKIPLQPFAGEMGLALGKEGSFSTISPFRTGGNLDVRQLRAGATLYLPIECKGALLSIGDGHAAQGDGEVCGTAIETPMKVKLRLTVLKDRPYVQTPHFETPPRHGEDNGEYYCTTGVEPDLLQASRAATRNMVEFLQTTHGIDRVEAYILCSVAGDLRIHEAVDMPNYVVGMMMPKFLLPDHVSPDFNK